MTNLFIGLVRGHRFLSPASTEIKSLGYQLFRIEQAFRVKGGRIQPEAIAISKVNQHTLLSEWTALDSPDGFNKPEQIRKYLQTTRNDLVNNAAIPVDAADRNSTWLVVRPEASAAFELMCKGLELNKLMLCSFELNAAQGYCITYCCGDLQDEKLSEILRQGITARRIPTQYMPFLPNELKCREYAEEVVRQVVSFAAKKQHEFSAEDVCSRIFGAWRSIDSHQKSIVLRDTKDVLNKFVQRSSSRTWIKRIRENPPLWGITISQDKDISVLARSFKKQAEQFLAECYDETCQLDLFTDFG